MPVRPAVVPTWVRRNHSSATRVVPSNGRGTRRPARTTPTAGKSTTRPRRRRFAAPARPPRAWVVGRAARTGRCGRSRTCGGVSECTGSFVATDDTSVRPCRFATQPSTGNRVAGVSGPSLLYRFVVPKSIVRRNTNQQWSNHTTRSLQSGQKTRIKMAISYPNFMLPKRRFWKTERTFGNVFSK